MSASVSSFHHFWGKARPSSEATNGDGAVCHLLPYHCLDVAATVQELFLADPRLAQRFAHIAGIAPADLTAWLIFMAGLHDIGKFAPSFQALAPDARALLGGARGGFAYTVRHDTLGDLLWSQHLFTRGRTLGWFPWSAAGLDEEDVAAMLSPVARAVFGHHGRPPQPCDSPLSLHFGTGAVTAVEEYVEALRVVIPPPALDLGEWNEQRFTTLAWLAAGLLVLCDWIGSNRNFFPYVASPMPLEEYWPQARSLAARAIVESGVITPTPLSRTTPRDLFPDFQTLTPLQERVAAMVLPTGQQCHILEDDTGTGKTEAALILASRLLGSGAARSVFLGLPTMATTNAMYDRVTKVYGAFFDRSATPSLVLAHSAQHLRASPVDSPPAEHGYGDGEEPASASCSAWLSDSRKKAFLAAFGVCTIDQALLGVLPSKHQSLRLLGLAHGVLVVDEVHAYDSYMRRELARLMEFQAALGGSAILLSATLPIAVRRELVTAFGRGLGIKAAVEQNEYPQLTSVSHDGVIEEPIPRVAARSRQIEVRYTDRVDEVVARVIAELAAGHAVCWIRNTVADAIQAHQLLVAHCDPDTVDLFHARFALGDRLAIERRVLDTFGPKGTPMQRAGRCIVATQVVEQSLDLDFDFLVSDLAPIDLLIQRVGRLHRHSRGDRGSPTLFVLGPTWTTEPDERWYRAAFRGGSMVYPDHGRLWLSAKECMRGQWGLPAETRIMVDRVYGDDAYDHTPSALQMISDRAEGSSRAAAGQAQWYALQLTDGYRITDRHWNDESIVPTRLGDPTVTLRLARNTGGSYTPWSDDPRIGWWLGEVSVRHVLVAQPYLDGEELDRVRATMPDGGRWVIPVVLADEGNGCHVGFARNKDGKTVKLSYDQKLGLRFIKERSESATESD